MIISNSTFIANSLFVGKSTGGIIAVYGINTVFENVMFARNNIWTDWCDGGVVLAENIGTLSFIDTKFIDNGCFGSSEPGSHGSGGALSIILVNTLLIQNSQFQRNKITASQFGLGIGTGAGGCLIMVATDDILIEDTVFDSCQCNAIQSAYGGAIMFDLEKYDNTTNDPKIVLRRVNFRGNMASASTIGSYGGAIAISCRDNSAGSCNRKQTNPFQIVDSNFTNNIVSGIDSPSSCSNSPLTSVTSWLDPFRPPCLHNLFSAYLRDSGKVMWLLSFPSNLLSPFHGD